MALGSLKRHWACLPLLVALINANRLEPAGHQLVQIMRDEATDVELLPPGNGSAHSSETLESLAGQVAKTVVYGGAGVMSASSRLLCALLTHDTHLEIDEQPTLFVFNNAHNKEQAYRIYADDQVTGEMALEAHFDPNQMTVVLVHGWLGGVQNELWLSEAKNAALSAFSDSGASASAFVSGANSSHHFRPNVVIVDWSELAHGSLYAATSNSARVAARLGRLLGQLVEAAGLRPELMHCLGHSIGAHICGRAARAAFGSGRGVPAKFGRITGLDPGGFCYQLGVKHEASFKGLRPSDALLVDAYYSNRSPFGNKLQVAQYNVRLGNGFVQAQCSVWRRPELAAEYFRAALRFLVGNVAHNDVLTCDHYFATRFALPRLSGHCSYVAYACMSYRDFLAGRCGRCESSADCYTMDFEYQRAQPSVAQALAHLNAYSTAAGAGPPDGSVAYEQRRVYYMQVSSGERQHCSPTFRVRLRLNSNSKSVLQPSWLRLKFVLNHQGQVAKIRNSAAGSDGHSLTLQGPWPTSGQQQIDPALDNRTLTGLFELLAEPIEMEPTILGVIVELEASRGRQLIDQLNNNQNPIDSIALDYLSSMESRIRMQYSRLFHQHQIEMKLRQHFDDDDENRTKSINRS